MEKDNNLRIPLITKPQNKRKYKHSSNKKDYSFLLKNSMKKHMMLLNQ